MNHFLLNFNHNVPEIRILRGGGECILKESDEDNQFLSGNQARYTVWNQLIWSRKTDCFALWHPGRYVQFPYYRPSTIWVGHFGHKTLLWYCILDFDFAYSNRPAGLSPNLGNRTVDKYPGSCQASDCIVASNCMCAFVCVRASLLCCPTLTTTSVRAWTKSYELRAVFPVCLICPRTQRIQPDIYTNTSTHSQSLVYPMKLMVN